MDPVSQGLLGATVAQSAAKKEHLRKATLYGIAGGMVPDLDILIRSASDPLISLEYHRHFTHSLAFIPIGGLIVAIGLWLVFYRIRLPFKLIYFYATLGLASHGLLDACTNYGTHLLWPFSNERTAWNIISIIDPVFTMSLLVFVVLGLWRKTPKLPRVGVGLALLYLMVGSFQHSSAQQMMRELAAERGHIVTHSAVMPSLGNIVLWRSIYEADGHFHIDAIYTSPFAPPYTHAGGSVKKLDAATDFPTLPADSTMANDVKRFTFFANDFTALHPNRPNVVGDFRYSLQPYGTLPLWGIYVEPTTPDAHAYRVNFREVRDRSFDEFWLMINGRKPE